MIFCLIKMNAWFYRDSRYLTQKEANGAKVFWGRGNGLGAWRTGEMLQDFPKNDKNRKFYEELFVTLSARVAELQSADGFWHASMLDRLLILRLRPVLPGLSYMRWRMGSMKVCWIKILICLLLKKDGRHWFLLLKQMVSWGMYNPLEPTLRK